MFSANALRVLEKRYFLKDDAGRTSEDPSALFRRVAKAVSASELNYGDEAERKSFEEKFYEMMINRRFMPNSPTLMNAGKAGGQLSACFVLPVPDNLEGIFETCKNAALIHKTGGGTGFSFSRIRPMNDRVATSTGVASGPVSFMTVYDAATEAIRQGGTRRGANMGILRIDHPDIEQFISCKHDTSKLNNFNISVAITDQFMQAVKDDLDFALVHPSTLGSAKPLVVRSVKARQLFQKIVVNAHATGEPGVVFIDRINAQDPVKLTFDSSGKVIPGTEDIEATNPCGEQPLGPGDACNLGSINVAEFLLADASDFDFDRLGEAVDLGVRFLDDVIDANHYPFPFVREATLRNRRIGLGLMGFAEALIRLALPYNSEAARLKAEQLMSFINERAAQASEKLALQRGDFPNWQYSTWAEGAEPRHRRNATVTTIAPTGTISIIAGTTSGIEPLFAVSFIRRVLGGEELVEVNPLFEEVAKARGFYSAELMRKIAHDGTLRHIDEIPSDIKAVWVCAHDIDYQAHVRMQAAFQKYTDNAVSKTINFPAAATVEEVENSYLLAYELGLKGITVYRDTSRRGQVLNISPRATSQSIDSGSSCVEEEPLKKIDSAGRKGTATSPLVSCLEIVDVYTAQGQCPQCGAQSESFLKYEACRLCVMCGYTKC